MLKVWLHIDILIQAQFEFQQVHVISLAASCINKQFKYLIIWLVGINQLFGLIANAKMGMLMAAGSELFL